MGRPTPRLTYAEAPDSRNDRVAEPTMRAGDALFAPSLQRILGCLFGQPQRAFSVSELIAESGAGSGATQRELTRLLASGLIAVYTDAGQRRYQANPYSPIHAEMCAVALKALDVTPRLPLFAGSQPKRSRKRP